MGPEIQVFPLDSEPYGTGVRGGDISGNRLLMGFHGRDHVDESTKAGVAFSEDGGRTWTDRVIIAAQHGVDFREPDTLSLTDGGLLAVMRTDTEPFGSYRSVSSDGGLSWSPPITTGFSGHCPRLFSLRNGIACFYRDMDPDCPGIGFHTSSDGSNWSTGGRIYDSVRPYAGWATACGYPSVVRLNEDSIFCLFHTDFTDGNSEIWGIILREGC